MVWYNPWTWFGGEIPEYVLHCDNPLCKGIIKQDYLAYDPESRKIYHNNDCTREAMTCLTTETAEVAFCSTKGISYKQAQRLFHEGKLAHLIVLKKKSIRSDFI